MKPCIPNREEPEAFEVFVIIAKDLWGCGEEVEQLGNASSDATRRYHSP